MNRCLIAVIALSLYVPPLRAQEAKEATERTEDIEVLRRILNKSLGLYLTPVRFVDVTQKNNQLALPVPLSFPAGDVEMVAKHTIAPFDGIYLKGHGVVFTLKIPTGASSPLNIGKSFGLSETCVKCHSLDVVPKSAVEAALDVKEGNKPYIEWLRIQDELRGKKPTDALPQATDVPVCEPGKLTARLTEKLFHNQHHVRNIPDSESFTVVVTYEGYVGSAQNRFELSATDLKNGMAELVQFGLRLEEAQQIRLGDLHLKNEKYQEAIDAYTLALNRFTKPKTSITLGKVGQAMTSEQKAMYEQKLQDKLRLAYTNLSTAYHKLYSELYLTPKKPIGTRAMEHMNKVNIAAEMATRMEIRIQNDLQSEMSGIAVPAKLIISFKRSDVTNSLVDFKKIVKVETIGFPPADPKPTPAKK